MTTTSYTAAPNANSRTGASVWTGRALSGLVVLFLLFDGAIKLVPLQVVIDTAVPLGWPADPALWRTLGLVLIASALLYAYPRTSILGAILITAYLGGAIATHVRIGSPPFSHTLFGVYLGIALWAGLWLRDPRVRALLPLAR
ncbi:DoxX family protein [Microvirga sp. CF3016]|uniref:DoxX family protein n=1 Tax=Microvirga sp. CF3016 TaxID=3110181 RepID=UPI002E7824BE|nr:DoxX family protein [Microvirga sp. CF3016]MEE1612906.1 DoxX family protein [Microvirga sp. CF3016]